MYPDVATDESEWEKNIVQRTSGRKKLWCNRLDSDDGDEVNNEIGDRFQI